MGEIEHQHGGEGAQGAALSNAVVHLIRDYTGRGPTQARTHVLGDLVTVVTRDSLTRGEQSLVRDGFVEMVLATRKAYQGTMRQALVEAVEGITGRKVIAFMSDNHIDPDVAVESFVLAPEGDRA